MADVVYSHYVPSDLESVTRFWNETFSGMRNFFEVKPSDLDDRIFRRKNSLEQFDPPGFIIARSGSEIAGFIHAAVRSETICKAAYGDWTGGSEGYIGIVAVAEKFRRRGIATELMNRAKKYLLGTKRIIIDGQCLNPYYGNSEGPEPPLWGTTEGISVPSGDPAVKALFAKHGFSPRYKAISLELDFNDYKVETHPIPPKCIAREHIGLMPVIGAEPGFDFSPTRSNEFTAISIETREMTIGVVSSYPMNTLPSMKECVYEIKVDDSFKDSGAGSYLLSTTLNLAKTSGMKICEVLAVPELSGSSVSFYEKFGFKKVASWDIY